MITDVGAARKQFFVTDGDKKIPVDPRREAIAEVIDLKKDGVLQDEDIKKYLKARQILKDPKIFKVDEKKIVSDFKSYLEGVVKVQDSTDRYHTFDEMSQDLKDLETKYPNLCQRVSLGKTVEGRDIWALKISKDVQGDTSQKPGVVFSGVHHAREWMSLEVPLRLAHMLTDGYATDPRIQKDVDNAEVWVVPCVNPDGYEYSRTQDNWWRKNRSPITDTGCPPNVAACPVDKKHLDANVSVGVDVNRNYADGKPEHEWLYRPDGDKPCRSDDDFGVTSDDPDSDVYRGPSGASENETKAMLQLELGRPNMKGVIDHHSYGELILHPWGHTTDHPDRYDDYIDAGTRMQKAMDTPYTLESSCDLYPTAGASNDTQHVNGLYAFTIEMGQSFQPGPEEMEPMRQNVTKADLAFLDWIVEKNSAQTPPAPPVPQPDPPAPPPQPPLALGDYGKAWD